MVSFPSAPLTSLTSTLAFSLPWPVFQGTPEYFPVPRSSFFRVSFCCPKRNHPLFLFKPSFFFFSPFSLFCCFSRECVKKSPPALFNVFFPGCPPSLPHSFFGCSGIIPHLFFTLRAWPFPRLFFSCSPFFSCFGPFNSSRIAPFFSSCIAFCFLMASTFFRLLLLFHPISWLRSLPNTSPFFFSFYAPSFSPVAALAFCLCGSFFPCSHNRIFVTLGFFEKPLHSSAVHPFPLAFSRLFLFSLSCVGRVLIGS